MQADGFRTVTGARAPVLPQERVVSFIHGGTAGIACIFLLCHCAFTLDVYLTHILSLYVCPAENARYPSQFKYNIFFLKRQ